MPILKEGITFSNRCAIQPGTINTICEDMLRVQSMGKDWSRCSGGLCLQVIS